MGISERSGSWGLVGGPPTNLCGLQYGDIAHGLTDTIVPIGPRVSKL